MISTEPQTAVLTTRSASNGLKYSVAVAWEPHRGDCPRCGQALPDVDEAPVVLNGGCGGDPVRVEVRGYQHGCGEMVAPQAAWSEWDLSTELDAAAAEAEARERLDA